jgi:ribosomal protein L24E
MGTGGYRRGRPHATVESCHSFSAWGAFQLALEGEDDDRFDGEWTVVGDSVTLSWQRDDRQWSQTVQLTWSPGQYGGRRAWLVCPKCGRRVGKLYLPTLLFRDDERVNRFACRKCYDLTYEQRQSRDPYWTLLHRAERLAERWLVESKDGESFRRPKGMHKATFEKRVAQYNALVQHADPFVFDSMTQGEPVQGADVGSEVSAEDPSPSDISDEQLREMAKGTEQAFREWFEQHRDSDKQSLELDGQAGLGHLK